MVALQRVWAAAAALLLAAAVTPAAGFLPPAAVGRRSALVLSRPACARPQVLSQQRRRSAGVRGMWAGGEEEPDMDAFREMLSDSWATDTAKQAYDDGVSLCACVGCLFRVVGPSSCCILHCVYMVCVRMPDKHISYFCVWPCVRALMPTFLNVPFCANELRLPGLRAHHILFAYCLNLVCI
jgi:hypothetical protein